jgi:hypothetical protein
MYFTDVTSYAREQAYERKRRRLIYQTTAEPRMERRAMPHSVLDVQQKRVLCPSIQFHVEARHWGLNSTVCRKGFGLKREK